MHHSWALIAFGALISLPYHSIADEARKPSDCVEPPTTVSAQARQIDEISAKLAALPDELPWIDLTSCEFKSAVGAVDEDAVCSRKTLAELLAWSAGADENCRGSKAESFLQELTSKVLKRAKDRVTEFEILSSISEETRRKLYEEMLADFPQRDWYASGKRFDALKRYAQAQKNISPTDSALLYEYFQNGYMRINPVLRKDGKAAKCLSPLLDALLPPLKRLPKFNGAVWRGLSLPDSVLQQYEANKELKWPAFSSTSIDRSVAEGFSTPKPGEKSVIFKILSKTCIDVRGASDKLREEEILCLPGTAVRVIRREAPNVIVLEEL